MDKILLGSLVIFAITASLFIGYWFGASQNLYEETKAAVREWCADSNNSHYCINECFHISDLNMKKYLDLNG